MLNKLMSRYLVVRGKVLGYLLRTNCLGADWTDWSREHKHRQKRQTVTGWFGKELDWFSGHTGRTDRTGRMGRMGRTDRQEIHQST